MPILIPLLASLILTIISTPGVIKFAKKYNLVDDPTKRPHPAHIQQRIVPRAGGLPIFISLLICTLLFIPLTKAIIGILLALTLLLVTGLLDDALTKFHPLQRLLLQFAAAGIVVISGIGITFVTNPLGGILSLDTFNLTLNLFGEHHIIVLADLFALFWIVWMMNMVNWSKGVDGQMPSITSIASITIGMLSYKLFLQGDQNQLPIAILSFITAGASLGLLIFNWHPAKIFPGFSGSTILAFMIAVLSILSGAKLATALLVLLIPSIDFFYTFFRRILNKKSPLVGDQKHLHHLLLERGWSHQRISYVYASSCALLGILASTLNSEGKVFALIFVSVVVFGSILWLHLLSQRNGGSINNENQ